MIIAKSKCLPVLVVFCAWAFESPAQQALPPMEVVGRVPANLGIPDGPASTVFAGSALEPSRAPAVDRVLGQVPGFSLFRRTSSLSAHPTAQGVSLRNLGPNGAGRTLVLLDGVPQNDPFGGWVNWTSMRGLEFEQAAVLTGSSPGLYGSQALTGVVRLTIDRDPVSRPSGTLDFQTGRFHATEGAGSAAIPLGRGSLYLNAGAAASDGFYQVPADQRGPIDRRMDLETWRLRGSYAVEIHDRAMLEAGGVGFYEERGNGSPQARNETEGMDLYLALRSLPGQAGPAWEALAYRQERNFINQFASVSEDRTSDQAVLEQFDVPGVGWGGSAFVRWDDTDSGAWTLGGDARWMDGETHERNRNLGAGFTRDRRAGGEQRVAGLFGQWSQGWNDRTRVEGGVRVDFWEVTDGLRIERNLETGGTVIRDDRFSERSGAIWTGRIDFRHELTSLLQAYAAVYRGFRLPTLNEYYRPFRVGNDITEANPELSPETLLGGEGGFVASSESLNATLRAAVYRNRLENGVTNVTLVEVDTGTFDPRFGFIPGGGSGRQRLNVDRVDAWGVELEWNQVLNESLSWTARYLFSDSEFAGGAGNLSGNRPAQAPEHTLWAGLSWQATEKLWFHPDLTWVGEAFEDDLNRRVLDAFIRVNATLVYALRPDWSFYLRGDNLTDEAIQTRVGGDGLVTLDAPFSWVLGTRISF